MRHRRRFFPFLLLLLTLTSCALAQPEAEGPFQDRLAGLYVVPGDPPPWNSETPHLTPRGSLQVDAGKIGGLSLPQYVLFGEREGDAYVFPGLEGGYSLFLLRGTTEDGAPLSEAVSDMAQGEFHTSVSDQGTTDTISGTLYYGPPLGAEDWDPYGRENRWTAYSVYQTPDGRLYLDGVPAVFEGGGAYTVASNQRFTANGQVTEASTLSAKVASQAVPRLERLAVTQFSAGNAVLDTCELPLQDPLPEVRCSPEAAWVLVEEYSGEGVVRTAYSLDAPISHEVVLLDEDGRGRPVTLPITP